MKIETINSDLKKLEKALKIVASIESNYQCDKSIIMFHILEQRMRLEDKKLAQLKFMTSLNIK
jgi:hypothetical protein